MFCNCFVTVDGEVAWLQLQEKLRIKIKNIGLHLDPIQEMMLGDQVKVDILVENNAESPTKLTDDCGSMN